MPYKLAPVTHTGTADWERAVALEPVRLTARQRRIYDYIRRYQQMWGATPLYREIAEACGLRSDSTVQYQVRRLIALGLARKPPRLTRVIRLTAVPVKPE